MSSLADGLYLKVGDNFFLLNDNLHEVFREEVQFTVKPNSLITNANEIDPSNRISERDLQLKNNNPPNRYARLNLRTNDPYIKPENTIDINKEYDNFYKSKENESSKTNYCSLLDTSNL